MPRSVTLVTGPPCAGKTTLVARLRRPGDQVADFDDVAVRLGSPGKWMHSHAVGDAAEREMLRIIAAAAAMESGTAWIIRCVPEARDRADLAFRLKASRVLVLKPALVLLLERAKSRPMADDTRRAVWRWMDRYEPAPCDELVRGDASAVARS
jgi:predicted kinase